VHPGVYLATQEAARKARECTHETNVSVLRQVQAELQEARPNHVRADSEIMAIWRDAGDHINRLLPEKHSWYQRPTGLIGIGVFIVIIGACAVKVFGIN